MKRKGKLGTEILHFAVFEKVGDEEKQITRWETDKGRSLRAFNSFVKAARLREKKDLSRQFFMRDQWFIQAPKEAQITDESPALPAPTV